MNYSKIFSYTLLTISSVLLIYIYYRSEVVLLGNKSNYYRPYYIISIFLLLSSFISFYLSSNIKLILSIISISIIISLYIFEGFLQAGFLSENSLTKQRAKIAKNQGIEFDERSRYEIYNELKQNNNDITVVIHPSQFLNFSNDIFTLAGISNKKTIHCNENGYFSIYQSDRYGFNNPDSEWEKKKIQFLLIGDSFVHGSCVNQEDTLSGNLRKKLNDQGVINLGYKGTGPLIQNAILREYGAQLKYSNILWFYFGNDIEDLYYELDNEILSNYFSDTKFTQNLANKQKEVDLFLENFLSDTATNMNPFQSFIKLSSIRKMIYWKLDDITKSEQNFSLRSSKDLNNFKNLATLTKDIADLNDSKIYFIYLPMFNRYDEKLKLVNAGQNYYDQIIAIIEDLEIPIIDIHKELFSLHSSPKKLFPFEIKGHYTPETYEMISEIIIEKLKIK